MGCTPIPVSGLLHVDVPVRRKREFLSPRGSFLSIGGPGIAGPKLTATGATSDSLFPTGGRTGLNSGLSAQSSQRVDRSPSIEILDAKSDTKRVVAEVLVQAPLGTLWDVLTDYEALPSYVPNLETCEVLGRQKGRIRLRQVGCSQSLLWRIAAEAELEVDEIKKSPLRREVRFRSLGGDFERLEGSWILESDVSSSAHMTTFLRYEMSAIPFAGLPSQIVSYVVKAGLPCNIRAIVAVAERRAADKLKAPVVSLEGENEVVGWKSGRDDGAPDGAPDGAEGGVRDNGRGESLPQKGPSLSLRASKYREAAPITGEIQQQIRGRGSKIESGRRIRNSPRRSGRVDRGGQVDRPGGRQVIGANVAAAAAAMKGTDYLGTTFVPLPPSAPPTTSPGVPSTPSPQDVSTAPSIEYSMESGGWASARPNNGIEVHLRRLDSLDHVHRRAVAAIRVNAPASIVWDVITDYNRLHEFVPGLAASERIQLPRNAPNVKRVRQVAYKNLGYMRLHAESVMDLVERPYSELQFRQVAGDVQLLQGKWMISEGLSTDEDYVGPSTDLKYAVEITLPAGTPIMSVVEPLLERMFFEELPHNLLAVKTEIERVADASLPGRPGRASTGKPRLADMMRDFSLLQAELEASGYNAAKKIPTRKELRADGRSDLDKCISAHGGRAQVAARMGWQTDGRARKPRGYWDSLDNLKSEIDEFTASSDDSQDGVLPLKAAMVNSGRYDLARAIEKWGGMSAVAEQLGYVTSSGSAKGSSGSDGGSLASGEYMLSSGEFEDLMYVEVDESGFDEKMEEEEMKLLEQDGVQDAGRFSSAREEIDGW